MLASQGGAHSSRTCSTERRPTIMSRTGPIVTAASRLAIALAGGASWRAPTGRIFWAQIQNGRDWPARLERLDQFQSLECDRFKAARLECESFVSGRHCRKSIAALLFNHSPWLAGASKWQRA
jgi:hypothetical protein